MVNMYMTHMLLVLLLCSRNADTLKRTLRKKTMKWKINVQMKLISILNCFAQRLVLRQRGAAFQKRAVKWRNVKIRLHCS